MGKDAPAPPDYVGAASATSKSSERVNLDQINANRPNVTTPWGKQTWTQGPQQVDQAGYDAAFKDYQTKNYDQATGTYGGTAPNISEFTKQGQWNQNITLTPEQQKALDSQQGIQQGRSDAAGTLLGQATDAFKTPFSWGDLSAGGSRINPATGPGATDQQNSLDGSSSAYRQKAQDAITQLQQPDLDRRRASEETRLANQGITKGSEAYDADMRAVGDNENRAHLAAISEGRNEDTLKFGQDLSAANLNNSAKSTEFNQGQSAAGFQNNSNISAGNFNNDLRSRQIAEQVQKRGMTLNELNALLTGQQVNMPNIPNAPAAGKASGVDFSGAANSSYGAALDASNASNAQAGQTTSALASAAGIAAYFAFSDARLKEDVTEVGLLPSGVRVVHYRYRGRPRRYTGVIAQEVARVFPEAVSLHPSGFLMVDYSKVQ